MDKTETNELLFWKMF